MKKKILGALLVLVSLPVLLVSAGAGAQSFKSGENVTIGKNETVESTLYAAGNNVNISGTVNGDVYCAGANVTIDATINGDVICAGQNVTVLGQINGDIRVAGDSVQLSATVTNNATIGAATLNITDKASIGGDVTGGVSTLTVDGTIGRDLVLGAGDATIRGTVGRNISSEVETLSLASTAKVGGSLTYTSEKEATVANGAVVSGETTRNQPERTQSDDMLGARFGFYLFLATLLMALVLVAVMPRVYEGAATRTQRSWGKTILAGLIAVIGLPIALIVLFITVLGIPLAFVVLLLWVVAAIVSSTFFGYLIGRLLWKSQTNPVLVMLVGMVLVLLVSWLPILGALVTFVGFFIGMGMIAREVWERLRSRPSTPDTKAPTPKVKLAKAK